MDIASARGEKNKLMLKGTSKLNVLKLRRPQFFSPIKLGMLLIAKDRRREGIVRNYIYKKLYIYKKIETFCL